MISNVPNNWQKIAEMHLGKKKYSPAESAVSFYVLDKKLCERVYLLLKEFHKTLRKDVRLVIQFVPGDNVSYTPYVGRLSSKWLRINKSI